MTRLQWATLVFILLFGALLRIRGLSALSQSLNYDEAYYVLDAASLLEHPRLTPFFEDNYGRESGWIYVLAPFIALFGHDAFGLRLAATFTGILTLAAIFRLAREIFREGWAAVWSAGGLSVLYWHVQFSHLIWRALLFPLVGTLAFALLWRSWRTNHTKHWIVTGILFACLSYTYFAARVWLLLGIILLIYGFLSNPQRRRGIFLATGIAIIGSLPLFIFTMLHSDTANQRISDVAVSSVGEILANIPTWLKLWFISGAEQVNFNFPGRPILDIPLLLLWVSGLAVLFFVVREKIQAGWILLLALGSAAITLITVAPENMIRMIGTPISLSLIIGAGAWGLQYTLARTRLRSIAILVPAMFLLWAGWNTSSTFTEWLKLDKFLFFEQHIYRATDYLIENTEDDARIYFSPFSPIHPVFRFHRARLEPRSVGAFDATQCWTLSKEPAYYYSLTMFDAEFAARLEQFANIELINENERDAIYRAMPHANILNTEDAIPFENGISLHLVDTLPTTVSAGDIVNMVIAIEVQQPSVENLTAFVHLYGDPTPYEGGELWAQTDQPICTSNPVVFWRTDEIILQPVQLIIPATTPSGDYDIAIGLYETQSQVGLMSEGESYHVIQAVSVE